LEKTYKTAPFFVSTCPKRCRFKEGNFVKKGTCAAHGPNFVKLDG
jgi:hypothetical protein